MKKLNQLLLAFACSLICFSGISQSTEFYHYPEKNQDLIEEFDYHDLYGVIINRTEGLFSDFYDPFKEALNSNAINESRSVDLLLEQAVFAKTPEDKNLYNALVSLKYFDQSEFEQVINYSKATDRSYLSSSLKEELDFKVGYAHFVNQNFDQADFYFDQKNDSYKHHNTYYGAMTKFFLGDKESAIKGFERIDNTRPYDAYVPYYLTQIYFENKDFRNVTNYGEKIINNPALENKNRVHKLLGLAYFELEDYDNANKHLSVYAEETNLLTKEEFYQIAYSQYKLGKHEESIANFKEISNLSDTLGNLANYYIAEIYLQQNDKKAAQTAFGKVSKISTLPDLQEDALFNYALLSYEIGEERIAINTLSKFQEGNRYFDQSQKLLNHVLVSSKDYEAAMGVIEDLDYKSPEILNTYQNLSYKLAIQNFNDQTPLKSLSYLSIAEETPGSSIIAAESIFWQAYIHHEDENMLRSQALLDRYFKYTASQPETKAQDIYPKAHYLQGYKFWSKEAYSEAQDHFIKALESSATMPSNKKADAQTRIADFYLKENNYKNASKYYTSALRTDDNMDYAAYQLGIVEGLNKGPVDKIVILEEFEAKYPESEYRDDALFEIGNSYFSLNKRNDALIAFNKLLADYGEESPMARKTLLRKGLISYNAGDVDEAIASYKEVFKLSPNAEEKKEALAALEEIYLSELNDPQAYFDLAENEGGVKLDDIQKDSLSYGIAMDQFKNGNYEKSSEAFANYRKRYKKGLYLIPAKYYEGESYSLLKQYNEAAIAYEMVIEEGKSDFYLKALKKAALIKYNHEQDNEKALKYFDLLVTQEGLNELEYIEGALVCANLTQDNTKVLSYADKLSKHPQSTTDQKATANFYLAKAAEKQGNIDQAIKAYNDVVRLSKNNKAAEASYQVAKLFKQQSNLDLAETQALETTKRAVNYPFWVAKSLLLLTDIFVEKKDVYNAKAAVEAVLDNYKEDTEIQAEALAKKVLVDQLEADENRVIDPTQDNTLQMDTLNTGK